MPLSGAQHQLHKRQKRDEIRKLIGKQEPLPQEAEEQYYGKELRSHLR